MYTHGEAKHGNPADKELILLCKANAPRGAKYTIFNLGLRLCDLPIKNNTYVKNILNPDIYRLIFVFNFLRSRFADKYVTFLAGAALVLDLKRATTVEVAGDEQGSGLNKGWREKWVVLGLRLWIWN